MVSAGIELLDIEVENLQLPDDANGLHPELLGVDIKNLAGANAEQQQLYFSCQVTILQQGTAVVEAGIICSFSVADELWATLLSGDHVVVPKDLAAELAETTLGIARGILFGLTPPDAKFKFILPLMNNKEYFTHDVILTPEAAQ